MGRGNSDKTMNNSDKSTPSEEFSHDHPSWKPCCGVLPYYPDMEIITAKRFSSPLHELMNNDLPYIHTGYRRMPINDVKKTFFSLFFLHNETMNILTHSVPLLLWIYMFWDVFTVQNRYTSNSDRFVMLFYLSLSGVMMIFSSLYHLFRAHSEPYYHWFLACDLRGIVLILAGCNMMTLYFELSCFSLERNIGFIVNIIVAISLILWIPKMVSLRLTKQRTLYFLLFSMVGGFGWIYRWFYYGNINWNTFWPMAHSYIAAAIGLLVKELKLPEKWYPYRFDIFGASHQLFHVIALYSAWILIFGYKLLLESGDFAC